MKKNLQNQPESTGVDYNDILDTEHGNTRAPESPLFPLTL